MNVSRQRSGERGGIITNLVALLFVVVLCVVVYAARHPILRFAAETWIVNEPAAHADAIIVLGDDNFYGRPRNASSANVPSRGGPCRSGQRAKASAKCGHQRINGARPDRAGRAKRRSRTVCS